MSEIQDAIVRLRPELLRAAARLAGDDAEDLVQDTVVRALRFAHRYAAGTNVRAWLHHVLQRVFVTRARRQRLERAGLEELAAHPSAWTRRTAPAPLPMSRSMRRALEAVPANFRAALLLIDVEEYSCAEAGAELGIPPGTVMSRAHRGRQALRARLTATEAGSLT